MDTSGKPPTGAEPTCSQTARLDIWLWAVRLTPTRSAATELCRAGRVSVNGAAAKAAATVKVGDRIEARIAQRQRVVEVVRVIHKRVGAPVAAECLLDHSPPVVRDDDAPVLRRDRGTGRPTKRDRREIDRLRHR
ncbi:MAG: S4 domain-containing protein [Actinomycetota bacterium]|nr:S4 domain-containing protein [Actinomycetota bacterium]